MSSIAPLSIPAAGTCRGAACLVIEVSSRPAFTHPITKLCDTCHHEHNKELVKIRVRKYRATKAAKAAEAKAKEEEDVVAMFLDPLFDDSDDDEFTTTIGTTSSSTTTSNKKRQRVVDPADIPNIPEEFTDENAWQQIYTECGDYMVAYERMFKIERLKQKVQQEDRRCEREEAKMEFEAALRRKREEEKLEFESTMHKIELAAA